MELIFFAEAPLSSVHSLLSETSKELWIPKFRITYLNNVQNLFNSGCAGHSALG